MLGPRRGELLDLRDTRIFPIFEGANDVMRSLIALSGMKPVGARLAELGEVDLGNPIGTIGVLADYVTGRIQREVRPDRVSMAHPELAPLADPLTDQVKRLAGTAESLLREHKGEIAERQFQQKRLSDAVADVYAQVSVLSRVTATLEEHGVEPSGQGRYIAETFCTRAARRVGSVLDQVEHTTTTGWSRSQSWRIAAVSTATPSTSTDRR